MKFQTITLLAAFAGILPLRGERVVESLNGEWLFMKDQTQKLAGAAFDLKEQNWRKVEVPHDWAISGPFDPNQDGGSGKLPWRGVGFYWKKIEVPATAEGGSVYLDFDGVMASPEVFVNGKKVGGWDYGYMSFRVDATPALRFGQANDLVVRADTRNHHSRWYPGAGIYRSVRMVTVPAVQLAHHATFVTTPLVSSAEATVRVSTELLNRGEKQLPAEVSFTLLDSKGEEVASHRFPAAKLSPQGKLHLCHDFLVKHPNLWDVDAPHLYTLRVDAAAEGMRDSERLRFGIRSFSFPPDDGFHLNGRRVQIKGVDLHADMGILGMAFNRSVMRRQLEIMKDMGANALRTSHNAPDPEVLDLCDEMGIIVWNECFDKWEGTSGRRKDQNLEEYVSRNLKSFVLRDRNHPSVFIWSIGNEIPPADKPEHPGMTRARCSAFREVIRQFDTTRPVAIGNCHGNAIAKGIFEDLDLTGWNYGGQYKNIKKKYPDKPVLYSESASAVSSYGYYGLPLPANKTDYAVKDFEVSSYDHNAAPWSDIPDKEFERMERDTYCGGEFVWTGIDYLGEPTPYLHYFKQMRQYPQREMARSSYFGIVDLTGIPKDRFYLYRSHWNQKEETVHILPHWNWKGHEGASIPVYVYTSGDSAELFLNGKSLGKRTKGKHMRQLTNLAQGARATASSYELSDRQNNPAEHALDGKENTRWCAKGPQPGAWWQVDLGASRAFRIVRLKFEYSEEMYGFTIRISDDAQNWRKLIEKKLNEKYTPIFPETHARYVRVVFNKSKPSVWPSLREVIVSNDPVSSLENPYYEVVDRYRLRWMDVRYAPGELKAVAYRDGKKIGEQMMRTAGKATSIRLTPEKETLPADGDSVVFVQVDLVDAQGTRDPLATNRIRFSLTGPGKILAVGNGNPRGYDVFTDTSSHPLYFGKAVVAVQRNKNSEGVIRLSATATGLETAVIRLK